MPAPKKQETMVKSFDSSLDESTATDRSTPTNANRASIEPITKFNPARDEESDEISEIEQPKPAASKHNQQVQDQKRIGAQLMKEAIMKNQVKQQLKPKQLEKQEETEEETDWDEDESSYKEPFRVDQSLDEISDIEPRRVPSKAEPKHETVEEDEDSLSEIPMAKEVIMEKPKPKKETKEEEKATLDDTESDIPMPPEKKNIMVAESIDSDVISDIPMAQPVEQPKARIPEKKEEKVELDDEESDIPFPEEKKVEDKRDIPTRDELEEKFRQLQDDVEATKQKREEPKPTQPPKRNLLKSSATEDDELSNAMKGLEVMNYGDSDEESSL
jgi:hypothetical protein